MIPFHDVAIIVVGLLGFAFLLIWLGGDRQNRAALLWGLSHLALATAAFTGFRFQLNGSLPMALCSTIFTGLFLTTLVAGNLSLRGQQVSVTQLVGLSLAVSASIGAVGFVGDQLVGRVAVCMIMILTYGWSATVFLRQSRHRLLGIAFALKAASLMLQFGDVSTLSTTQKPFTLQVIDWATNILLGLALVYLAAVQSRRRLHQLVKHLPDAVVARRRDGTVVFCNDAFARLMGTEKARTLIGTKLFNIAGIEEDEAVLRSNMLVPVVREQIVTPDAVAAYPAEVVYSKFLEFGAPITLTQIRDLTGIKHAEAERLRQATIDELTGLPNRRLFEDKLTTLLWESESKRTQCAMLLIDLDHFRKINDSMGHIGGDRTIAEIAHVLLERRSQGDILARLGGDEFAVARSDLPLDADDAIQRWASDICNGLRREIRHDRLGIQVSASVGVAVSGTDSLTPKLMLKRAELAMYEAKRQGRDRWVRYESSMEERLSESLHLESELRGAIRKRELQLHYQPIYHLVTGRLAKVEALVRWNSQMLGRVPPDKFIAVAEQSDLILQIGDWILDEAIGQAARWRVIDEEAAPVMSINVSARQFTSPGFEDRLFATIRRHKLEPNRIELELTETLLAAGDADLVALLQRLRREGFGLSLDDFGTGYSSLSYLSQFDLTTLKIDRSFINQIARDDRSRALVNTIIAMGHSLGLKVVAEGVETERQCEILALQGCDYLQGYLLGKPVAASELAAFGPHPYLTRLLAPGAGHPPKSAGEIKSVDELVA